jgi:ribose transport system ATP-binding protein
VTSTEPMPLRLDVRHCSKFYGRTDALVDVGVQVRPGEVHALLGQNGSGKSTLIKILSGYTAPQPGAHIAVDGVPLAVPIKPQALTGAGISYVHQDLGLIDSLSVMENVRVGRYDANPIFRNINRAKELELVREVLRRLGSNADPRELVSALPQIDRAYAALARALYGRKPGAGLLMLDEVTRSLPRDAALAVYQSAREVVADGGSVLLVTHRLDEVIALADRLTVLRDGRVVTDSVAIDPGMTTHDVAQLILGRRLDAMGRSTTPPSTATIAPVVVGQDLSTDAVAIDSIEFRPGEIVGITGAAGSGVEQVADMLAGAAPRASGTLWVRGRRLDLARNRYNEFLDAGVALVPDDRPVRGLALTLSIRENVTLPRLRRGGRWLLRFADHRRDSDLVIRKLGVVADDDRQPLGELSGGNQQKVLIGKWLLHAPQLLILHEPTQGVDIGARRHLLQLVRQVAQTGCAVALVSVESDDIAEICDRVLVISQGRITRELLGSPELEEIMAAVYGHVDVGQDHTVRVGS